MKKNKKNIDKTFRASIKSFKMSDKKIRPLAKYITGKNICQISLLLSIQTLLAAKILLKLINHAMANMLTNKVKLENYYISEVSVNKGRVKKKIFSRSQGRVNYIDKKTSHIFISIKQYY